LRPHARAETGFLLPGITLSGYGREVDILPRSVKPAFVRTLPNQWNWIIVPVDDIYLVELAALEEAFNALSPQRVSVLITRGYSMILRCDGVFSSRVIVAFKCADNSLLNN
jgi:hypothetical protein